MDHQKLLAKSAGAAKPASRPVTRRIAAPGAQAPATRSTPKGTHWHIERQPGTVVSVKHDGQPYYGKIADWNDETGWAKVDTHDGRINARIEDLRPSPSARSTGSASWRTRTRSSAASRRAGTRRSTSSAATG